MNSRTYQFGVLLSISVGAIVFCEHIVKDGGNNQRSNAEGQQRCRGLSDSDIEELLASADSPQEKRHSQHEQEIGEHATD